MNSVFFLGLKKSLPLIMFRCMSSFRCPCCPYTGAGPSHLIGRLCQQQFPSSDLPSNPPDHGVLHRGSVSTGVHEERPHQPGGTGRLPHRNLHCHRGDHRPQSAQTGAVMRGGESFTGGRYRPRTFTDYFRAHFRVLIL